MTLDLTNGGGVLLGTGESESFEATALVAVRNSRKLPKRVVDLPATERLPRNAEGIRREAETEAMIKSEVRAPCGDVYAKKGTVFKRAASVVRIVRAQFRARNCCLSDVEGAAGEKHRRRDRLLSRVQQIGSPR